MRIRNALLIHPSRSTRALIKKYILAELSDIDIFEAGSGQLAVDQINGRCFDVIVSTDQLKDMTVADFKSSLEATTQNGHTPLIVICESESNHAVDNLRETGFEQVVRIRVRPSDLIKAINAACNPRDWRKDARYHIPRATVRIAGKNADFEANLINISMGGLLVELLADKPADLLNGELALDLRIPLPSGSACLQDLTAKLLRLEAVSWTKDHVPHRFRASFIFNNLKTGPQKKLAEVLETAKAEKLQAEEIERQDLF